MKGKKRGEAVLRVRGLAKRSNDELYRARMSRKKTGEEEAQTGQL